MSLFTCINPNMKKLSFLVLILTIASACKKSDTKPIAVQQQPTAITYTFSANQTDTYTILYTDSNKTTSTVVVTGASWSKTMSMQTSSIPVNLTLNVQSANQSFEATGTMTVAVEGHPTSSMPLDSHIGTTYGLRGQIIYSLTNY